MFELIFLKILLQISLILLQTVTKCYINIQYTVENLVKMIFKPPTCKKLLFLIRPNLKKFQICNGDIYEIWLTLLCEAMTYFMEKQEWNKNKNLSHFMGHLLSSGLTLYSIGWHIALCLSADTATTIKTVADIDMVFPGCITKG